ncbi:hypothetical protein PIB30_082169 [Stylosanthes scabra]|uniref:Uncharacterized protein n=1 Tax=Stylosanthes scabra TaxID=79078 RepID=A0ABU6UU84_9FABA|nr:hypothetical protein [Stylosanthes scabra]
MKIEETWKNLAGKERNEAEVKQGKMEAKIREPKVKFNSNVKVITMEADNEADQDQLKENQHKGKELIKSDEFMGKPSKKKYKAKSSNLYHVEMPEDPDEDKNGEEVPEAQDITMKEGW